MIEFDESRQNTRVSDLYKKEEEELVQLLADRRGLPYIDLTTTSVEMEALRTITEEVARKVHVAAFKVAGHKLYVAVLSSESTGVSELVEDLERKNFEVTLYMVSKNSLERAWAFYRDMSMASETKAGVLDIRSAALEEIIARIQNASDVRALIEEKTDGSKGHKISTMLEILIAGALATKASDIHIEPEERDVKIRFRLDGLLTDIYSFNFETYKLVNSRIKLLSHLKISIKEDAQDGRFTIAIGETEIEIRTSLIPGSYGESIVMRVLNPDNINVSFDDLGIEPKLLDILQKAIDRPNGIVLNTGPTGSGKTTTLYSFLRKVHNEDNKIITIEDPIEYHLAGITQTQVNEEKGYTFLQGLRASLRQDPDIIMVGEIRDSETAKVAINSALTGHLVLSTLHTNSAAGAVPRLIELGVNPKILSSALSIILAQRLVRKVCTHCREIYNPIEPEKKMLESILNTMIANGKTESLQGLGLPDFTLYRGRGCDKCHLGYKGRLGIYEAIVMDKYLEEVLFIEYPSEREVRQAVVPQHIPTLREDAVVKVLRGLTTIEEVSKVIDMYEE
ncbi:MAG: type pilus assembly ATPase PilB, type pilus assembly protein PilB [Candidatus Parcubacteria bacterium]|jgi:type IV pilus assembly protein PilB